MGATQVQKIPNKLTEPSQDLVVWDWRRAVDHQDIPAEKKRARVMGAVQVLIGYAVAAVFYALSFKTMMWVVAGITTVNGAIAFLSPLRGYRWIQKLIGMLALGIGTGMTWLLLGPLYYLVFLPVGFFRRRALRESVSRGPDKTLDSYWKTKGRESDTVQHYGKPY